METEAEARRLAAKEFHLEEWKSLREEIAANGKETRDTERNIVIACFVIWVWVLKEKDCAYWPALVLPPIAALLGMWRCNALGNATWNIGEYLKKIETEYRFSPDLGWEHNFRGEVGESPQQHRLGVTATVFWSILVIGSILMSVLIGIILCRY
jgi:hypothetical protein